MKINLHEAALRTLNIMQTKIFELMDEDIGQHNVITDLEEWNSKWQKIIKELKKAD